MKKIFVYAAVAALAMTAISCQKENLKENVNVSNDGLVFTASIDAGMDTKTTLTSEKKVNWEATDEITINGVVYTATPKSDATKADFTKKNSGDADPTGTFNAFYPTGILDGVNAGGTLPAEQTYTADKITNVPMFATSTTTSLSFKNICAVLAVKVTSADIATLKAIKVKSNKAMSGAFTISDDKAILTDASDASKAVTLVSSAALTLDADGITFYIAIPAQEYSFLEVYLSSDGTAFTQMMCTKKKSGLGTIASNSVYPIDYAVNAVQLWAGGPYWATTNIGADASTDYGQYFAWGYTTAYSWTGSSWSPTITFDESGFSGYYDHTYSDMAIAAWGAGWSVPTADQFDILINYDHSAGEAKSQGKCSVTYVETITKGIRVTGTTSGYTTNSIFLPAAGYGFESDLSNAGYYGYYWSSVQDGSYDAYYLFFDPGDKDLYMETTNKYYGHSVRPVRSSL